MVDKLDPDRLTVAFQERDAEGLLRMAEVDPIETLNHLDGSMRGLRDGPQSPEQVKWLVEQDRRIRLRYGGKQREVDLRILQGAYQGGDLFLTVGAGISQGAGMPGWKTLVLDVLKYALDHGTPEHREKVERNLRRSFARLPEDLREMEVARVLEGIRPASGDPGCSRCGAS